MSLHSKEERRPVGEIYRCVEGKPALVFRVRDSLRRNAIRNQPVSDLFLGLLRWLKGLDDLLWRPMLPEVWRIRMGPS